MYLIAGLGNPDKKYQLTRHNTGFMALDKLSELLGVKVVDKKFKGLCQTAAYNGEKLLLLKPLTYMNNSGEAVRAAADFYKIEPDRIIILYDDINFECGRLRVRGSGSAGGHNGIKSIIAHLGTEGFPRVRIGVGGLSEHESMVSHVLGKFSKEDMAIMQKSCEEAAKAALCIVDEGVAEAMNRFNGIKIE
ncbi:MAG TPA: aminoacyl-tRNA hydrolase [Candidatus Avilachnospira avistercoris]|nr:aminoacyl-tRNA hydrolase [Candidatus Avilachnospira avistercoris]